MVELRCPVCGADSGTVQQSSHGETQISGPKNTGVAATDSVPLTLIHRSPGHIGFARHHGVLTDVVTTLPPYFESPAMSRFSEQALQVGIP